MVVAAAEICIVLTWGSNMCPAYLHIRNHNIWRNTLYFSRAVEYMQKSTALKQDRPGGNQFLELLHDLGKII